MLAGGERLAGHAGPASHAAADLEPMEMFMAFAYLGVNMKRPLHLRYIC